MNTYSKFRPSTLDSHISVEDREPWLVAPVSQTRDSGPLEQSNFAQFLAALGGESENVEVHRFGHWGPGWFEIILIDPAATDLVSKAEDMERALSDYPVLSDEDFSRREWESYGENWDSYSARDFCDEIHTKLGISDHTHDRLLDCDKGELLSFFESLIPSGDYYSPEDCSPRTRYAAERCTREQLFMTTKNTYRKNSIEAKLNDLLPPFERFDVIAHELWRDDGGWSVNNSWKIGRDCDRDEAISRLVGRWHVFKANYHSKARVRDLTDANWSGAEFPALLEVDCIPFAEIRNAND